MDIWGSLGLIHNSLYLKNQWHKKHKVIEVDIQIVDISNYPETSWRSSGRQFSLSVECLCRDQSQGIL